MRIFFFTICSVLLLGACSSPKYAYYFDRHDYNSGKKSNPEEQSIGMHEKVQPLSVDNETLVASADETTFIPTETEKPEVAAKSIVEKYKSMSAAERKEFRKELKNEAKSFIKQKKKGVNSIEAAHYMDNDLKLAAIFGAVGIVLTLFGGINSAFWILGVIAIVIAVVFLVKWLVRQ